MTYRCWSSILNYSLENSDWLKMSAENSSAAAALIIPSLCTGQATAAGSWSWRGWRGTGRRWSSPWQTPLRPGGGHFKILLVQGLQRYFTDGRLQVIHIYQDRQGIFTECMIGNYLISSALLRGNKCLCNKRQIFYNNYIVNFTFYENTWPLVCIMVCYVVWLFIHDVCQSLLSPIQIENIR